MFNFPRSSHGPCLLVTLFLVMAGCSTLPDYAAPKFRVLDNEDADMSDVIAYRDLRKSDFKGGQPPQGFDLRMAAVTCVYAEPVIDKDAIEIDLTRNASGQPWYRITLNNLSYRALMDRNCSWWNPKNRPADEEYTLQHEQIHFALFELAARRWSEEAPMTFEVKAANTDIMTQKLRELFEAQFEEKLSELSEENRLFDEQTSMGFNPLMQASWHKKVMQGLATLSAQAPAASAATCDLSPAARDAIIYARKLLTAGNDSAEIARLLEQAESAARPPECDSVRAKILADKAIEYARQAGGQE